MQSVPKLTSQLQQLSNSFIQTTFYDPTTLYLGEVVFDRDDFKKLKKDGWIEMSFEDQCGRRYSLSNKGREIINNAGVN